MQAIVTRPTSWTTLPVLALLLALPGTLPAQQPERYAIAGSDVSIYNLAGEVRIEPGSGADVVAELTRAGADAGKLKVLQGEIVLNAGVESITVPSGTMVNVPSRRHDLVAQKDSLVVLTVAR